MITTFSPLLHPPLPTLPLHRHRCSFTNLNTKPHYLKTHRIVPVFALNGGNGDGSPDPKPEGSSEDSEKGNGSNGGGTEENRRVPLLKFKWTDLFDPDPDNVVAVGLTGLLTWASVQVVFQLLFVSFAIVVAALKYSFVAALLLFIVIALL